jgi:hypothetical protein
MLEILDKYYTSAVVMLVWKYVVKLHSRYDTQIILRYFRYVVMMPK